MFPISQAWSTWGEASLQNFQCTASSTYTMPQASRTFADLSGQMVDTGLCEENYPDEYATKDLDWRPFHAAEGNQYILI